jgi:hypothetical protein
MDAHGNLPSGRTLGRYTPPLIDKSKERWHGRELGEDVAVAQIVTAATTVFYAAVFTIGYYMVVKGNRETLREMREESLSGGAAASYRRGQSLLNLPVVELVVRNVTEELPKM